MDCSTAENTKECPYCGELVRVSAKKCRHCGEYLDPALKAIEELKHSESMRLQQQPQTVINQNSKPKSRCTYVLLDLFFGCAGVHNFYAGFIGTGIIQFILSCTIVGLFVTIPWCILEMIIQTKDASGQQMA